MSTRVKWNHLLSAGDNAWMNVNRKIPADLLAAFVCKELVPGRMTLLVLVDLEETMGSLWKIFFVMSGLIRKVWMSLSSV